MITRNDFLEAIAKVEQLTGTRLLRHFREALPELVAVDTRAEPEEKLTSDTFAQKAAELRRQSSSTMQAVRDTEPTQPKSSEH